MNLKTYTFNNSIKLVNFGDLHIGNKYCDIKGLKKVVDYIKNNDDVYWLSSGDILEVNLKSNKTFDYEGKSLQKEIQEACDLLEPIRQKCLGIVGSNHHKRIERAVGLNLDGMLSRLLSIPYLGVTGFLRIICDGCGYFVCIHHSTGFGRTRGAKANAAKKLNEVFKGYDIYLNGHTHCFQYFIDVDTILDRKHYKNMNINSYIITTGHYLDYRNSYAEEMLLPPAPKGSVIVGLNQKIKNINVDFKDV